MLSLDIQLFGAFAVTIADHNVPDSAWNGKMSRSLIQYLAVRPEGRATADELIETFWPHLPAERAKQNLYVTVNRLRQALSRTAGGTEPGAALLRGTAGAYQLPANTRVDYWELLKAAQEIARLQAASPREALERIQGLSRCEPDSLLIEHPYADWAIAAREQVRRATIGLSLAEADLLVRVGRGREALEILLGVLKQEPLRESTARWAMALARDLGEQVLALQIFEGCRRALADDLGVDPMPETVALHIQVLRQQSEASRPAAAPPDALAQDPSPTPTDGSVPAGRSSGPTPLFGKATFLAVQSARRDVASTAGAWVGMASLEREVKAAVERFEGLTLTHDADDGALVAAFARAGDALRAALAIQRAATGRATPVPLRMALHAGVAGGGFPVPEAARHCVQLAALAHGGQILLSAPAAERASEAMPPNVLLQALGSHRLRDLFSYAEVFGLITPEVQEPFPPLLSLDRLPHNLPAHLTSFVGRDQALRTLRRLLSSTRLLTLTGAGGSGKTRLALQLAAEVLDAYPDGAWLVELAPVRDPDLLLHAVADALGVREESGRTLAALLTEHLRPLRILLVLDNCEHLADGCAVLVEQLLTACPGLRIVATSQHVLEAAGETVWHVPPLSLPTGSASADRDAVTASEAGRLFLERAEAAGADLSDPGAMTAIAEICLRLDGLPLAIELAAARVRHLSVQEIAERLHERLSLLAGGRRTALPRQRTLRGAVAWSYDLLSPHEQALWRRLSVFAGGAPLPAAQAVVGGEPLAADQVPGLLFALADKSLLVVERAGGETRFRLLETIRIYGMEQLQAAGEEAALSRRHRDWYLAWASEAEAGLRGPEQAAWLDRCNQELGNVRAALRWSQEQQEWDAMLRLAAALGHFWERRGHIGEGLAWLEAPLAASAGSRTERAWAFNTAGSLARVHGEFGRARGFLEQGISLARALEERPLLARALNNLGATLTDMGDPAGGLPHYHESLALLRQLEQMASVAVVLNNVGTNLQRQGQFRLAAGYHADSLAISRDLGDDWNVALTLNNLGTVAVSLGDYQRTEACCTESRALFERLGDRWGMALAGINLGLAAQCQGDLARAAGLVRESLGHYQALGNRAGMAGALESMAWVAAAGKSPRRAARLLGAADALRSQSGASLDDFDLPFHQQALVAVRAALEPDDYATAFAAGRVLPLEQAVAEASADEDAFASSAI